MLMINRIISMMIPIVAMMITFLLFDNIIGNEKNRNK